MSSPLLAELARLVYPERQALVVTACDLRGEPRPPTEAVAGQFEPFTTGEPWGGQWSTVWFRFVGSLPQHWPPDRAVALIHLGGSDLVGFSAEGLVWDASLRPVQGLHHEHRSVALDSSLAPGGAADFYVEAAANPVPRWSREDASLLAPDYGGTPLYVLEQAEMALVDPVAQALLQDATVATGIAEWLPERRDEASTLLEKVAALVASGRPGSAGEARSVLAPLFAAGQGAGDGGTGAHPPGRRILAVGHAHIDSAWLWPVRETRRKCGRSFANQLRLMERYPEHRFACSQAVQYAWIKSDYPELFDQIRERVADGRWEPVGGMWVEADCNIPSGESLLRQFVHGKRFFREEFGIETSEMWIPDVFGYSAALPQIARHAGVTALITQKMSWNETNVFPRSTFWWEGHDGSTVLAHFPPAATYNGSFSVAELLGDIRNFKDADRTGLTLYPFGFGDGGGGPTAQMLEAARRLAHVEPLPPIAVGRVSEFLAGVAEDGERLARWVGELYLETHRGTYTTHADVKLGNRRSEEALRAAEMWSVAAGQDRRETLDPLWKKVLLDQFHDIIPGSSIHWVYEDTAVDYREVLDGAATVSLEAEEALCGSALTAFNAASADRAEVVELPGGGLAWLRIPGCGWSPVSAEECPFGPVSVGQDWMDNGLLRVTWDGDGLVTSVWDHEVGREVIAPGRRANVFQLHEDLPRSFDAWNVDRSYLDGSVDLAELESAEVVEESPLRAGVRFTRRFGDSWLTQVMRLAAGSRRLEFDTECEWQEDHRFLKVAFPVAVRSARATYEIQHGHVERPTVENTTWDEARFEVCAQRWAHLGEPGYGVALLNDCKYGYDIRGDTIRLSLLRAPKYPDPAADRGRHRFRYALYPHSGDLRFDGRVPEAAEAFNLPVTFAAGAGEGVAGSVAPASGGRIVTLDQPGISVEAVKPAEEGGGFVVRLCEVYGARRPVRVGIGRTFSDVWKSDALERPASPAPREGDCVCLDLRPFELVTLLFRP